MTFEFETKMVQDKMIPYCISFYDGNNTWSMYIDHYINYEFMIKDAFIHLLTDKYNGYVLYGHFMSGFDGIFIMKILSELCEIKPIIKDGKIIELKLKYIYKNKKHTLTIRDSFMILPQPLRKTK